MVASRPLSPSAVCSWVGPAVVEAEGVGTAVVELVPGADGLVLGADGKALFARLSFR